MSDQLSPLDRILDDIIGSYNAGFYYVSVTLTLAIPDICSSLETRADERKRWKVEARYKSWFNTYLAAHFHKFTADDCWALRGGVVHNGMLFGHPQARYNRIVFMPPSRNGPTLHECISADSRAESETILQFDIRQFCSTFIDGAKYWYKARKDDPIVASNLPNLVRERREGFPPHFVGCLVIA